MQQPASSSVSVVFASDVGGKVASATLTRQNNTTPYIAGDVLSAMAGDPLASVQLVFAAARQAGGSGTIMRAILMSSTVDAGLDNVYLYLFTAAPTVADDNAPFVITLTNLVGVMKLALQPAISGGTIWASAAGDVWAFQCGAATANLWGVLVVGDGWTPTAQQAFTISLHVDRQ